MCLQQPTCSKRHRLRYRSRSLQDSKRHFLQVFSVHRKKMSSIFSVRFLWNITALFIFSLNTRKKNSILVFCARGSRRREWEVVRFVFAALQWNYLIALSHSLHAYLVRVYCENNSSILSQPPSWSARCGARMCHHLTKRPSNYIRIDIFGWDFSDFYFFDFWH